MVGEVFEDGEGGHGEDSFLFHQAHGFVAELVGVIDGGDTRLCRIEGAGLSGRMHGNMFA